MKNNILKIKINFSSFISHFSSSKGFTLIELLVVIGLLGVLSGGLLTIINPLDKIDKANDARRKSDLSQIQKALEQYYQDFGKYPSGTQANNYQISTPETKDDTLREWGTAWSPYIDIVPKDPSSSKFYIYISDGTRQYYKLYASLDRADKDSQACAGQSVCPGSVNIPCGNNATIVCTYGVSSPNVSP